MRFDNPCQGCQRREVGCREKCARWLVYAEARKRWLAQQDKERRDKLVTLEYTTEKYVRWKREHDRKHI